MDRAAAGPQSAVQARVSTLEVANVGTQNHLNILERWLNQVERRLIAVERSQLRISRLEREIRRLSRAIVLLLRALQDSRSNYNALVHRIAALETAGL